MLQKLLVRLFGYLQKPEFLSEEHRESLEDFEQTKQWKAIKIIMGEYVSLGLWNFDKYSGSVPEKLKELQIQHEANKKFSRYLMEKVIEYSTITRKETRDKKPGNTGY